MRIVQAHSRDQVSKERGENKGKKGKEATKTKMEAEEKVPNKNQKKAEELQEELKGARKIVKDKRHHNPSESKDKRGLCESTMGEILRDQEEAGSRESDGQIGSP